MEETRTPLAEATLCKARLYRPARNTYQRLLNRPYYKQRAHDRAFLRRFVPAGSLVIDVGANRGLMSERFLELGAQVVALEPIPWLAQTIRRRYPAVTVVEAAVSAQRGEAILHLGCDDLHSTISEKWAQEEAGRFADTLRVPVTTLAAIIKEHGAPAFIKIDVEGHEDQVLATLDRPVRALSFEYQCPDLQIAERSVSCLESLGRYQYAAADGEQLELAHPWGTREALFAHLVAHRDRQADGHGDVYARLV